MKKFLFTILCVLSLMISSYGLSVEKKQSFVDDSNNVSINLYSKILLEDNTKIKELDIMLKTNTVELLNQSNIINKSLVNEIHNISNQLEKNQRLLLVDNKTKKLLFLGYNKNSIKELSQKYYNTKKIKSYLYISITILCIIFLMKRYKDRREDHKVRETLFIVTMIFIMSTILLELSFSIINNIYLSG